MMGESLFSNDEFTAFDCGFSRKKLGRPEILYLFYWCIFLEKEAGKMHLEKMGYNYMPTRSQLTFGHF